MRAWFAVPVLAALCALLLSAADYYARVPLSSPAYTDLKQLSSAGLLPDWKGPEYALLRLEIAMLLQTALPKFYDQVDADHPPDSATEAALKRLTSQYKAELSGLGVEVRSPLTAKAAPGSAPVVPAPPVKDVPLDADTSTAGAGPAPGEVMLEVDHGADQSATAPAPAPVVTADDVPAAPDSGPRPDLPGPAAVRAPKALPPGQTTTPPLTTVALDPAPPTPPVAPAPPATPHKTADGSSTDSTTVQPVLPRQPNKSGRTAVRPPTSKPAEVPTPTEIVAPQASPEYAGPLSNAYPTTPDQAAAQGGSTSAPPEQRNLNVLLSRRNDELGTVAQSVERTDSSPMPGFEVQDDELGPVQPFHAEGRSGSVKAFGDLRGQAYTRDTRLPGGSDQGGGLRLYWGDLGVDATHAPWSARVTLNYNDVTRQPKLHELWAQYMGEDGMYARAGRVILPFADRKGEFPTFSAAHQLGFTSANAAGIGWNRPDWGASVWAYDAGGSGAASGGTNLSEFALSLSLFQADCTDDSNGWRVALAYLSNLAGAEQKLAGGALTHDVPALNLTAGLDLGGGRYHVNLDYTGATRRFAAADVDANGNGQGDLPQALSLELLLTPQHSQLYGLRFEHTTGDAGAAANRWSALYGRWLSEQLLARLELSRGQYNDYTPGKRHDLGVTADVRLVF